MFCGKDSSWKLTIKYDDHLASTPLRQKLTNINTTLSIFFSREAIRNEPIESAFVRLNTRTNIRRKYIFSLSLFHKNHDVKIRTKVMMKYIEEVIERWQRCQHNQENYSRPNFSPSSRIMQAENSDAQYWIIEKPKSYEAYDWTSNGLFLKCSKKLKV